MGILWYIKRSDTFFSCLSDRDVFLGGGGVYKQGRGWLYRSVMEEGGRRVGEAPLGNALLPPAEPFQQGIHQ